MDGGLLPLKPRPGGAARPAEWEGRAAPREGGVKGAKEGSTMHKLKTMALVSLAWLFILATDGPATASNICHTTLTSGSGATFFRWQ